MSLALPRRILGRGTTPYIDVDATLLLAFGAVQMAILNIAIEGRKPEAKPLKFCHVILPNGNSCSSVSTGGAKS